MSERSSSRAPRKRGKLVLHGGNSLPGCPEAAPAADGYAAHAAPDIGPHIGIDEAGRGCLAGPVVAAAVLFPDDFSFQSALPGLGDSKQLSEKLRSSLATGITAKARAFGIGLAWQDEIDAINILNATFRAMSRAVLSLAARLQTHECAAPHLPLLLIDGNKTIPEGHWLSCTSGATASALSWEQYFPLPLSTRPSMTLPLPPQRAVVGGDALVPAISAASVLAKTVRDGIMQRLDEFFPGYGLAGHKGYGTREHLEALGRLGPCSLHRLTFQGVKPADPAGPKMVQPLLL